MNYVIIGNSAAAVGCIEGIRQVDKKGAITVISNEKHHTYSRPLISYLLYGKTDKERMKYRGNDFYEKNGVTPLLGKTVTKICQDKKKVVLDDGKTVDYDKLLIATGSRPFVPPMEGLELVENKFNFMTLDDAEALGAAITPQSRVLVVGAGLIGLKCVEGIFDRVASVTVVDLAARILPSILDEKGSAMVQAFLENKGVVFHLGASVKKFTTNDALLTDGETLPFDVAVIAVGVRPNVELAKEIGVAVERGILTDEFCRTNRPDIYAAGDCSQSMDITTGTSRVLALLPNAYMQGESAGLDMASSYKVGAQTKPYNKAMPMNAIGFFGYHIITAGSYDGDVYTKEEGENYKKLVTKDHLLKGFILIGDVKRAGIYTAMVRDKTPLDSVDFDLLKEAPQLMAFAPEVRAKKLGGKK